MFGEQTFTQLRTGLRQTDRQTDRVNKTKTDRVHKTWVSNMISTSYQMHGHLRMKTMRETYRKNRVSKKERERERERERDGGGTDRQTETKGETGGNPHLSKFSWPCHPPFHLSRHLHLQNSTQQHHQQPDRYRWQALSGREDPHPLMLWIQLHQQKNQTWSLLSWLGYRFSIDCSQPRCWKDTSFLAEPATRPGTFFFAEASAVAVWTCVAGILQQAFVGQPRLHSLQCIRIEQLSIVQSSNQG